MKIPVSNLQTKHISEFTPEDTIYISDMKGFNKPLRLCQFVKYSGGRVTGTIIEARESHERHIVGTEISATLTKCALYGATAERPESPHMNWFRPTGYAYTEREATLEGDEERDAHESYGVITVMKRHGGTSVPLFGSSIRHNNTIALRVHEADVRRSLNKDWIHSGKGILELEMSPSQFADMITSGGQGGGTPITIRWRDGRSMEACQFRSKREQFRNEFQTKMRNVTTDVDSVLDAIKTVIEKKSMTAEDRNFILSQVGTLKQEIASNMPFVAEQFDRQMDKSTTEAKAEIEAFFDSKIHSLGLGAFTEQIKQQLGVPSVDAKQLESGGQ